MLSDILSEVSADQLPRQYGGTMTDPDGNPNCITKVGYYFKFLLCSSKSGLSKRHISTISFDKLGLLGYQVDCLIDYYLLK